MKVIQPLRFFNSPAKIQFVFAWLIIISFCPAWAQPSINAINKTNGPVDETVTILGDHFGTNASDIKVFFGASTGTIESITDHTIEANVPAGSSYSNISVVNTSTGLMAFAPQRFFLNFKGTHPFNPTNLTSQTDFSAGSGLYDHCTCDFNGDGKVDIATANDISMSITLFQNTSTISAVGFTASSINVGTRTIHVACGDLNGDGLPDLIATEGGDGNRVFVLKNNGGFAFSSQTITLAGIKTKQIQIADLDLNGKPELIISDQGTNRIALLINQSTTATVAFNATPVNISVTGASSTDGLQVQDLNGDLLPEIITSNFLSSTGNIYVMENTSSQGTFRFDRQIVLPLPGTLVNLKVGDLNGDSKPEIVASQFLGSSVSILENESEDGAISFASPMHVQTDERPWGIDLGDLDGDGKPDIVVGSITKKTLTVLNNTSEEALSFSRHTLNTTFINRHVRLVDIDGDAKPDVTFTSIDDNSAGGAGPASKISIMRNKACVVPELPLDPLTLCTGILPFTLKATNAPGATYAWTLDGFPIGTSAPTLNINAAGTYKVSLNSEGGTCSTTSNELSVTISSGTTGATSLLADVNPVCAGQSVTLTAASSGATAFNWTGPDGFAAEGASIDITDFSLLKAGRYDVDVIVGSCIADRSSIIVDINQPPPFHVSYSGSELLCEGGSKTLAIAPVVPGYTFQWHEASAGPIAGATGSALVVSESGDYFVRVTSACQPFDTDHVSIVVASIPTADFDTSSALCREQEIQFINQSTSDAEIETLYTWTFGDGGSSDLEEPTHSFSTAASFNVMLTVSYEGGLCAQSVIKPVTILSPSPVIITTPGNVFTFCPDEELPLTIEGNISEVLWSTQATTSEIIVTEAGTYSANVVTVEGCPVEVAKNVTVFPAPAINISAIPPEINIGESSQLEASGLVEYLWSPAEALSDPAISNPVASPDATTTYLVTGTDVNGCAGSADIELLVTGGFIAGLLGPQNFFSPNGDASNPFWSIAKIDDFPQCSVSIFNEQGIKVFEAKPYMNSWDGTANGKQLPDGVYYYAIQCDGDTKPRLGSITLLR